MLHDMYVCSVHAELYYSKQRSRTFLQRGSGGKFIGQEGLAVVLQLAAEICVPGTCNPEFWRACTRDTALELLVLPWNYDRDQHGSTPVSAICRPRFCHAVSGGTTWFAEVSIPESFALTCLVQQSMLDSTSSYRWL